MSNQQNTSFWYTDLLPKYQKIFDENKDNWLSQEMINLYHDAEQEYFTTKNNYKKGHNEFLYGFFIFLLILSILLLFIPFYWVYKKFKALVANKQKLLNEINKAANDKLMIHSELIKNIDIFSILNLFKDIINYQHKGPIPNELIEHMQSLSLFDLSKYDNNHNPYNTSWAVVDNKIIIHASNQEHEEYMETYTGSTTVNYSHRDSNGNIEYHTETVTATYSHPAYHINYKRKTFSFMESCSHLLFSYDGKKKVLFDHNYEQKHNYRELENDDFNKLFKWVRNDAVQFRMIFTPYTQEQFLKELDNKKITDELKWAKDLSFFYNQYEIPHQSLLIYYWLSNQINDFINNVDKNINDLKTDIFNGITGYYHNIFKAINYFYITTIFASENHQHILNAMKNKKNKGISNIFYAHNVLTEILNQEIHKIDTDCFNILDNINVHQIDNNDFYIAQFEGLTYQKNPQIKYVSSYAYGAGKTVEVPVKYYDYKPKKKKAYIGYMHAPNLSNNFFNTNIFKVNNSNNQNFINLCNKINNQYKVVVNNGILSLYSTQPFDIQVISDFIQELSKLKNN